MIYGSCLVSERSLKGAFLTGVTSAILPIFRQANLNWKCNEEGGKNGREG